MVNDLQGEIPNPALSKLPASFPLLCWKPQGAPTSYRIAAINHPGRMWLCVNPEPQIPCVEELMKKCLHGSLEALWDYTGAHLKSQRRVSLTSHPHSL